MMPRSCLPLLSLLLALSLGCDDGDDPADNPPAQDTSAIDAAPVDAQAGEDAAVVDAQLDEDIAVVVDAEVDEDAVAADAQIEADVVEADEGICLLTPDDPEPDFVEEIGCRGDHEAVAAPPLVASIPGVRSSKTVVDRIDESHLYFQNSRRYPIHWDFASAHLSGQGLPIVPPLGQFNQSEYYSPDRRFILGALNFYEGPRVWAYEIAPYDAASAALIEAAFDLIRESLYVGDALRFHPTSDNVAREAERLPEDIPIVTTDELYEGIIYQPLNLATSIGQLRFFSTMELETRYLSFRDIAVLETVPNDLSVCVGTITDQFQTPLSHINVLAQNRGTPNMGLRGAFQDPTLRALEGRWVELTVGASEYTIREVTEAEADAWWEAHRPDEIVIPSADLSITDLRDIEEVLDVEGLGLEAALAASIPAFGGKASHYGAFPHMELPIPYPKAFVVPIYYYDQFMRQNGFDARVEAMLEDPAFQSDPAIRADTLDALRDDMKAAPVDPDTLALLTAKLEAEYAGVRMKFRSTTNCEDLEGFTGAGLYQSAVGDPNNPSRPYDKALRKVWSSIWRLRAFEERAYRGIEHRNVGMAVLIHRSFPTEDSNGVAVTANIFDPSGIEPGYYINVQAGDVSVVEPQAGVTSDQFVYHYDMPGQPIVYLGHSSEVPAGENVLTRVEVAELAEALSAIHAYFAPLYGPNTPDHFYAMDIEFKFDSTGPSGTSDLVIKQARPYPGRGGL